LTTLRAAVRAARDRLLAAGVAEDEVVAEIEAEVLLRHAINRDAGATKAYLYARYEDAIEPQVAQQFEALVTRRLAREPSAHITGRREFYGLDFKVTPDVLIPRPETEQVVESAIKLVTVGALIENSEAARPTRASGRAVRQRLRIADIGTGSGAIAVSLAQALPGAEVYATDVSRAALGVAAENARRHGVDRSISFRAGHLLTPLYDYVDLIVANLPYVTTEDWSRLEPELREHEPRVALDGGRDGLDLIRDLLRQAPRYLRPGCHVLLEIGEGQVEPLASFIRDALPSRTLWSAENDFAGIPRVLSVLPRGA
jgi:release factor glutamine methyltransferase